MVNQESMAFLQLLSKELTLGQIRLPSFPDAVIQIRDALEQEDCDINRITELASLESVLASRLMQSANSAFYNATNRTISDLKQAVMRLGLNEVRNMAIALAVEQIFIAQEHPAIAKDLAILWRRSIAMSSVAYVVAGECSKVSPEQAFLCGLLHEIGKLYMITKATEFPGMRVDMLARSDDPDTWHPQIGRCIVEDWGFDEVIAQTMEPIEHFKDVPGGDVHLVDVVYGAEIVCSATDETPVDFEHGCLVKLGVDEERLAQMEPRIGERMQAMMQSLSG